MADANDGKRFFDSLADTFDTAVPLRWSFLLAGLSVDQVAPLMIQLTGQQRQAVKNGEAIHVAAQEIGEDVVLLSAIQDQEMWELLEDQRGQKTVLHYSMKQAAKYATENTY